MFSIKNQMQVKPLSRNPRDKKRKKTRKKQLQFFSLTAKLCYEVFSPDRLWCDPVQLQHQVPGKVPEGSGGFRCRYLLRFRRVPVQIPGEVSESFNADGRWGCAGFRCRSREVPEVSVHLVRFWRVPMQIPGEVPEGSGADSRWGSGGFRCRYSGADAFVKVQRFPMFLMAWPFNSPLANLCYRVFSPD